MFRDEGHEDRQLDQSWKLFKIKFDISKFTRLHDPLHSRSNFGNPLCIVRTKRRFCGFLKIKVSKFNFVWANSLFKFFNIFFGKFQKIMALNGCLIKKILRREDLKMLNLPHKHQIVALWRNRWEPEKRGAFRMQPFSCRLLAESRPFETLASGPKTTKIGSRYSSLVFYPIIGQIFSKLRPLSMAKMENYSILIS